MHPILSIKYENMGNLSVTVGRAAASGGPTEIHGVVSNGIRLSRMMLSTILPAGSGGGNPTELPSEGAYMNLLCMADKPGVSTEHVRTES